jgi:hypothetical protein
MAHASSIGDTKINDPVNVHLRCGADFSAASSPAGNLKCRASAFRTRWHSSHIGCPASARDHYELQQRAC